MEATSDRAGESRPPPQPHARPVTRVLLIANETVAAPAVRDRILELVGDRDAEVFVVAPALTSSALAHLAGDVDEAIAEARARLDESVRAIRTAGLAASGEVGDSDPNLALEDALRRFPADHVVISTHPPGRSKWLELDVVEKARAEASVPITHVVVDMERGGIEVQHVMPRLGEEPATTSVYDLPRMPTRDSAAIAVGVVGTLVLGVLAIICSGDISEEGMSAGCAIRIGLAIATFIVTLFHVAALFLFGYTRYHGRAERFAAYTLLIGIPAAILVSALVG
jgi:hypothetical protein